jgi:hypothetical protein
VKNERAEKWGERRALKLIEVREDCPSTSLLFLPEWR